MLTGRAVAVKVVPLAAGLCAGDMQSELAAEIALLTRACHRNVVEFHTAFLVPHAEEVWVVMELAELGSLHGSARPPACLIAHDHPIGCQLHPHKPPHTHTCCTPALKSKPPVGTLHPLAIGL